ncbi:MAG: hypothetical protein K0R53_3336 [Burkholderiales bacterium]|nr:hypothetical protein [Burkholderiales bacterium]
MMFPFSPAQFFEMFARINEAICPAQFLAYGLVLPALTGAVRPSASGDRITSLVLAAMWLFTGVAYHWVQFSKINPVAPLCGFRAAGRPSCSCWPDRTRGSRGNPSLTRPWVRIALVTYFTPNDPQNWLVVRSGFVTAGLEMQRRATTPNRRGMAVP